MKFEEPNLLNPDKDGFYKARIEQVNTGRRLELLGYELFKERGDELFLNNRPAPAWIFSLITGYRQLGVFKVPFPHDYKEGQDIIVEKKDDKITVIIEV